MHPPCNNRSQFCYYVWFKQNKYLFLVYNFIVRLFCLLFIFFFFCFVCYCFRLVCLVEFLEFIGFQKHTLDQFQSILLANYSKHTKQKKHTAIKLLCFMLFCINVLNLNWICGPIFFGCYFPIFCKWTKPFNGFPCAIETYISDISIALVNDTN